MGYLRKNDTVANPAKKSLTVFQNSYTQSTSVPTYGHISIDIRMPVSSNIQTVYNNSDVPIEWRVDGKPTVTIGAHSQYGQDAFVGLEPGGYANYGHLYTKAGAYIGKAGYGGGYSGTYVTGYTTQYSTKWNTKWSKLSA